MRLMLSVDLHNDDPIQFLDDVARMCQAIPAIVTQALDALDVDGKSTAEFHTETSDHRATLAGVVAYCRPSPELN